MRAAHRSDLAAAASWPRARARRCCSCPDAPPAWARRRGTCPASTCSRSGAGGLRSFEWPLSPNVQLLAAHAVILAALVVSRAQLISRCRAKPSKTAQGDVGSGRRTTALLAAEPCQAACLLVTCNHCHRYITPSTRTAQLLPARGASRPQLSLCSSVEVTEEAGSCLQNA